MQGKKDCRTLNRCRQSEVLGRQCRIVDFLVGSGLPEKRRVDFGGGLFSRRPAVIEFKENVTAFDFRTFSARKLNLIGIALMFENHAGFVVSVLFKKKLHSFNLSARSKNR